jgi:two-component system, LytTR family, response regulator
MQRIIIIDDTNCKPLLKDFLRALKQYVQYDVSLDQLHSQLLLKDVMEIPAIKKISIKSGGNIYLIDCTEIIRVEAHGRETILFHTVYKSLPNVESIEYWQSRLYAQRFFRVHKAHLVNIACIVKLQFGEVPFLILNTGEKIPVDISDQMNIAGSLEEMIQ